MPFSRALAVTEAEGGELAGLPKFGDPADWEQVRPHTLSNSFGVTNELGQTIPGLHVEFEVFLSPRLGSTKYVFSLFSTKYGVVERAYQMEVNLRRGLPPNDHRYSHEHYGDRRLAASEDWAYASFPKAVERFCQKCNLKLSQELDNYLSFVLK